MPASVQIPVTQTGLEASIQAALRNAGKGAQINLGANARQINALAQPLGRITGQADEFTKSMEAANARVFAFGASVGIINGVTSAFSSLVKSTIAVEKSLTEINSVFQKSSSELEKFGNSLFDVAKNTGQSFDAVAKGALELARQGLSTEESLRRINDALILTRLSGLDAERSVSGLTAAVNAFKSTGITTSEVLNKLVVVSQKYSVSEKDLIEGLKRSSSVAKQAGVSFDELVGIITAVQEKTSVGGAVIGNSFKTIFTRLQRTDTLDALQQLGVSVTDVQGRILPATKLLENLAGTIKSLNQVQLAEITEKVGGGFQIDKLLATLEDLSSQSSVAFKATEISLKSTNEAYEKNAALNVTLAALINKTSLSAEQLGATLGKIGITDSAKNLLGFFNGLLESIQKILGEESALGDVFRGLAKGIGNLITGPGLALFAGIILKLSKDLAQFGFASLKGFFGIGKAAKEIQNVEQSIASALSRNVGLQQQLFALEGNRAAQIKLMSDAIVLQEAAMRRMASTASTLAAPLYGAGVRSTGEGLRVPRAAGGYTPAVSQESSDIRKGVGGAKSGDRPVVIPNFNFGQGKKGSIVAHTGEYTVPNFAGSGGTAIFNRDMVRSMGLPSGAKKISASGGLIPNFAEKVKIVKNQNQILEGKNFESILNKRLFGKSSYSPNDPLDFPLPQGYGLNASAKKQLGINNLSRYGDAKRSFSRPSSVSLMDKYLRTKEGELDFRNKRISERGFINLKPDGLSMLYKYGEAEGVKSINVGTKNSSFSVKTKKLIEQKLIKTKNPNLSRTISMPLIADKVNLASGFIPNFSNTLLTDTIRQYYPELENYRVSSKKFVFPNGIEAYQSNIDNVLKRNPSFATKKKALDQKKLDQGFLDFNIDANTLGGIALVTPKQGDASGYVSAKLKGSDLKDNKPRGLLDDDQIILSNIQQTGVPTKKNFEQISSEINKFFAGPIVALAQSLYGRLYSGMQAGEFTDQLGNLKSTSKGGILPAGAEGQLFEAASKAALTTMKDLSASFDPKNENRPFDFTNPAAMNQMLGVKAVRGDAKRGGGSAANFQGQVNTLVKKSMNDGDIAPKILSQISQQSKGRKSPNAAGGFIPNFANPLKDAVNREMAAGVPASQIYVDKNPSLKSVGNPMGLMVANRRDEPAGGYQGINRAIKEGRNPKTYGAASGFVPNYVDAPDISGYIGQTRSAALAMQESAYQEALKKITKALDAERVNLKTLSSYRQKERKVIEDKIQALQLETITLQKSSEATKKAIIEQSKGVFGTGKTATLKETTVRASGEQKDMLGTIFALQGAFSILTGYTDSLSGEIGSAVKAVSNAASGITTAAFAYQGSQRLLAESTGGVGKALGKVGIAGSVLLGVFEVFKAGKTIMLENNGSTKQAAENARLLAESAEKAANRLDELDPNAQQRIKEDAKFLLKSLEEGRFNRQGEFGEETNYRKMSVSSFVADQDSANFQSAIENAKAAGLPETSIASTIFKEGEKNRNVLGDYVLYTDNIKEVIKELGKLSEQSPIKKLKEDLDSITNLENINADNLMPVIAPYYEQIKNGTLDLETQRKILNDSSLTTMDRVVAENLLVQAIKKGAEASKISADENKKALDLINTSYAQNQLKNTIDISIAQQRTTKELDLQLLSAKELNNLSEKDIRSLENKITLRNLDRKLVDETSSLLKGQIDKAKLLVANKEKTIELEGRLKTFSEDDFKNKDEVTKLLGEINILLGTGTDLTEAERKENEQILDNLLKKYDLDKEDLKVQQQKTEEYKTQASTIKDIISSAQRASQQRSFGIDMTSRRSQFSNTKQIAELQASKLGRSPDEIKRIDANIAAIEANTVSLENVANYNKMLADKRTELLGLTKFSDEYQADEFKKLVENDSNSLKSLMDKADRALGLTQNENDKKAIEEFIIKLKQESESLQLDAESSQAAADTRTREAGAIEPVISALEMFRRSLLDSTDIIDRKIQDLELEKLTSISGRRNAEIDYEIETLNQQKGQSAEEAARTARKRQAKTIPQLFKEEYSKTMEERTLEFNKTIVDASIQFKNNLIDGISKAIEEGGTLADILKGGALDFVRTLNKQLMSNMFNSLLGSNKNGSSGLLGSIFGYASGGPITGGSGTKDDVPAMLMGGEYVINKKSVGRYGPKFLEAINNGTLGGYAQGGKVQSGKGGFFTPGTYGLGGIQGTGNLLKFATQGYTSGARDQIVNQGNYASINLEAESARLTNFGRSNSPQAEATRSAKEQAFGLYVQDIQAQQEAQKQAEAESDALKKQLMLSVVLAAGSGFFKAYAGSGTTGMARLSDAAKGIWSGFEGKGGLTNLFSFGGSSSTTPSSKNTNGANGYDVNPYDNDQINEVNSALGGLGVSPLNFGGSNNGVYNNNIPAFTTGPFDAQGNYIEERANERFATGGSIPFKGGIDTVPAMLSGGEFIMNRSAAQNIGAGNLQALNAGAGTIVTEEKTEELNEKLISKLDELIEASGGASSITINVEGSTGAATQSTNGNPTDQRQQMARQIKDAVLKILQDEKRLGGQLRR